MQLSLSCLCVLAAFALHSAQASYTKQGCFGSIGGAGGHIYQFDGGVVSTYPKHCDVLLTRSHLKFCHFAISAKFGSTKHRKKSGFSGISQLRSIDIRSGGKTYRLLRGRRLSVNGKLHNVPYSEKFIRVFFSGDDLVFVQKKCGFWVTFNGHCSATYRLSSRYRRRVSGLAGNCDGRRGNDIVKHLDKAVKVWQKNGWIRKCTLNRRRRKYYGCHSRAELHEAKRRCKRVILGAAKCGDSAVLTPCVRDFCAARYHPHLQVKLLCANFYLHARRCAGHNRPVRWRKAAGCPKQCHKNEYFSYKLQPCPRTCENHFFGSPKRCFKLSSPEGCRCRRGFVLDGSKCVRPSDCVCLAKLCIDRLSHSKCRHWKALGRCRKFPDFMSKNCRLTCGLCTPTCKNQVSTKLCKIYKKRGKCAKDFYRAMCKATCNPAGCSCPPRRVSTSSCSPKYKNRVITSKKWWPDRHGRCRLSLVIHYRPCGLCRKLRRTKFGKCNFCKQIKFGQRIIQFREKYGKRRCIHRVKRIHARCPCPPRGYQKVTKFVKCEGHRKVVKITKIWKPSHRCTRCKRFTSRKVVKTLNCYGIHKTGKCIGKRHFYIERVYKKVAHKCKCKTVLVRSRRMKCRCRRPHIRRVCKGSHWKVIKSRWYLRHGRCHLRVTRSHGKIRCSRNYKRTFVCKKRYRCKALAIISYNTLKNCKCTRITRKKVLGKCCCPKDFTRTIRVSHYWKKKIYVKYILVKYKCRKVTRVKKIRVACPRGGSISYCDSVRGIRVHKKWYFKLKGHSCVKVYKRRKVPIKCRRKVRRVTGRCHKYVGHVKYRYVVLKYYKRKGCKCIRASRRVREMCGCRGGRFVRVTKCPRGCTRKRCGKDCSFSKIFFVYSVHKRSCRRRVIRRIRFRCCCQPNRVVRRVCRSNKFWMKIISVTLLKNYKCQRVKNSSSRRVRCRTGTESEWQPHPHKKYRYRVTRKYYISDCKCKVRVTKRVCRAKCRRAKKIKFCDHGKRDWVTRKITWKLYGCKTCTRRVRDVRRPVRCKTGVKKWRKCNKVTGVITFYKKLRYQRGCKCLHRVTSRTARCRCRKPVIGKYKCYKNSLRRRVTKWILRKYRCVKYSRMQHRHVKCSGSHRFRTICHRKSGVSVKYIGVMRLRKCKCKRVWTVHRRYRCNCHKDNIRVKNVIHRYCYRNKKIIKRFYFVLLHGKCVRRSRRVSRGFRCSRSHSRLLRCNLKTKKQVLEKYKYVKRKCKCVRVRSRIVRKCGCRGKRIVRRKICKRMQGILLTITITKKWSHRKNSCITKKKTHSYRVSCSRKTKYRTSKCINKKYFIQRKIYFVRRNCRCERRVRRKKLSCHCPARVRHYSCPRRGYFKLVVTELRVWNMRKRACRRVRLVTRKVRCRCHRGFVRRLCKAGVRVKETVRFALKGGRCHKYVTRQKQRVVCRGRQKYHFSKCRKCQKYKCTLAPRVHPTKCLCYYKRIRTEKCKCCCPKSRRHKRCIGGKHWQIVTTHFAPFTGRVCKKKCRKWKTRRQWRVPCRKRRRFSWLRCNRKKCISKQQVTQYVTVRCKCKRQTRLTGAIRTCCCSGRTRVQRVCKSSRIYKKISFLKLVNWRCVRMHRLRLVKSWRCSRKVKTVIGRCNRRTCKQRMHDVHKLIDRPHCRCRRVTRRRRYRRCCCNRKPRKSRECVNGCWVTKHVKYSFSKKRRVCVSHVSHSVKRVRCNKRRIVKSRCSRRSCKRKLKIVFYILRKCRCHRRVTFKYNLCCCRRPINLAPTCERNRKIVTRRLTWRLVHGRCVKSVKKHVKTVTCRSGVIRIQPLSCNRRTCRQKVKKLFLRLRDCRCHKYWRSFTRTCCCRPAKRTWTKCVKHTKLFSFVATQKLNRKRQCVTKLRKVLLHAVKNCRRRRIISRCNRKTRHLIITTLYRKAYKCRCTVYRRTKQLVLCRCPHARKYRTKCSRRSCHFTVTSIWYTSKRKGSGVKCSKHRRQRRVRCCCHRQLTAKKFCHKRTGAIKKKTFWKVFSVKRRVCITRTSVTTLRRLRCPRTKCHTGGCNSRTGYRIRVCTHFISVRSRCRCEKRVTRRRIVCSCRKSTFKKYCQNNNRLIRVRKYWKISRKHNRCLLYKKKSVKQLRCSKLRWKTVKCGHGCAGKKYKHFYKMHKCKCVHRSTSHPIRCCCPRSSRKTRCHGNKWVTEYLRYKLKNGKCVKKLRISTKSVKCKTTRVTIGRCVKCKFVKVTMKFRVRGCKCKQVKRRVQHLRCCCHRPSRKTVCKDNQLVTTTVKYRLRKHKCLRSQKVHRRQLRCRKTFLKVSGCNRRTRKRRIVKVTFKLRRCRCHRRRHVRFETCRCRPSHVVAEKCRRKKVQRKVFVVSYHLVRKGARVFCRRRQRVIRTEPCRCKNASSKKICVHGYCWLTTKISWKLIVRHGRNICIRRTSRTERLVRCKRRHITWTKCHKYRKTRITVIHKPVNCHCKRFTYKKSFACGCSRKNFTRRVCDAREGNVIIKTFSFFSRRGARQCSSHVSVQVQPVRCRRRFHKKLLSRKCGVKKGDGWYSKILVTWTIRKGCKCVRMRKRQLRLCRCKRLKPVKKCEDNDVKVQIHKKYVKKRNVCQLTRRVSRQTVTCRSEEPKVKFGGCDRRKCRRSATVKQCFVKNCKTKFFIRSRLQLCCTPKPKTRVFCDKNTGEIVKETILYYLVPHKPLLKDINGETVVVQNKIVTKKVQKRRKIKCRRPHKRVSCNTKTGKWLSKITVWKRFGCHCKPKTSVLRGKCRCESPKKRWGRCIGRYKIRTIIKFVLRARRCIRYVQHKKFLCSCPKRRKTTVCDGRGRWQTCRVSYQLLFHQQRCRKLRKCRRRRQTCSAPSETRGRCRNFRRRVVVTKWRLNKRSCKCKKMHFVRYVGCNCRHKQSITRKCVRGAKVTIKVTHVLRGEKCVRRVRRIYKHVYCSKRRTSQIVKGSCVTRKHQRHRGFQKLLIRWFVKKGCKCIPKSAIRWVPCRCSLIKKFATVVLHFCSRGTVKVTKTVYFKLKHLRCIRKLRIVKKKIRCHGSRPTKSKCRLNSHGDSFRILKNFIRVSNGKCGCRWKLHSVKYRICKCRKTVKSRKCVRHRVIRRVKVSYKPVAGRPFCRRHVRYRDTKVRCRPAFWRSGVCKKCRKVRVHFVFVHRNCKCVRTRSRTLTIRCCCPKKSTKRYCDRKRHVISWVTTTFKLKRGRCLRRRDTRTKRIRCSRMTPLYWISKCHKGYRIIKVTTFYAVGCKCHRRIHKVSQRCSCSRHRTVRRGKCGRRFAIDVWYALKLVKTKLRLSGTNKYVKKCVRFVVAKRRRRCRCPSPVRNRQCKIDRFKYITITYRLHGNSCVRKRTTKIRRIPCSRTARLVRVQKMHKKCSRRYNFIQKLRFVYVKARACKCMHFYRTRAFVCNCFKKYGGYQITKKCVNNRTVKIVKIWHKNKGKLCKRYRKVKNRFVKCSGVKVRASRCNRKGIRKFTIFHKKVKNCGCVWRRHRIVMAPCKCRRSVKTISCHGNKWVKRIHRWKLIGIGIHARCKKYSKTRTVTVKCKVGIFKHKSRCLSDGFKWFITTKRRMQNCKCRVSVIKRRCRCRCRRSVRKRFCRNNYWISVIKNWQVRKCSCHGDTSVKRHRISCPRQTRKILPCRRGHNGDKYVTEKIVYFLLKKCKCIKKLRVRKRLCGCDPRTRIYKKCKSDVTRVTIVTRRLRLHGRCVRQKVKRRVTRIKCGKLKVTKLCHKKSGILTIIVMRPFVKNCKCHKQVSKYTRRCGCHAGTHLIKKGRCNRNSCRQRLLLKRQILHRHKCVWKKFHKFRICCCRGSRIIKICKRSVGVVRLIHKKVVLIHGQCVTKTRETRHKIHCKPHPSTRHQKLPRGVLKILHCRFIRRNCECVKKCKVTFKRYKCYTPKSSRSCKCYNGRCKFIKKIHLWILYRGRCIPKSRTLTSPLKCPDSYVKQSRCTLRTRYGWKMRTTRVSWKQRKCKCVKIVKSYTRVCRCQKQKRQKFCDSRSGRKIFVITKFKPASDRKSCKKIVTRKIHRVHCDSTWRFWRRIGDGHVFYKVFRRFVRRGCRCVRQKRRVSCRSQCRKCKRTVKCQKNRILLRIVTCWKLIGCRCKKVRHVTRKYVKCKKSYRKIRCNRRSCKKSVLEIRFVTSNCRCHKRVQVLHSRCCCPKPKVIHSCVRNSWRLRRIFHLLKHGKCHVKVHDKYKKVRCSTKTQRAIIGRCVGGKRKYAVHFWVLRGCRCLRRIRVIRRPCSCAHKAVDLIFAVDMFGKDTRGYKSGVTRYLSAVFHYFHKTSVVLHTTVVGFNTAVQVSKKVTLPATKLLRRLSRQAFVRSKTDLHEALSHIRRRVLPNSESRAEKILVIVTCGHHTKRRRALKVASKIKKEATIFVVQIGDLSKKARYLQLLATRPTRSHFLRVSIRQLLSHHVKSHFSATKLFESICKRACRRSILRRSRCNRRSCRRMMTRVTFRREGHRGRCVRKTKNWNVACCCKRRIRITLICRQNRKLKIVEKFRFSRSRLECLRQVSTSDVSAEIHRRCKPKRSVKLGRCIRMWQSVTIKHRRVVKCKCHVTVSQKRRRCGCPPSRSQRLCRKGYKIAKCTMYFVLHKGVCLPRRRCSVASVKCRRPRLIVSSCRNCFKTSTRIWYSVRHCKCRRHFKKWKRRCCCSSKRKTHKYCDRQKNRFVRVTSWLRLHKGSCRRVTKRVFKQVKCPKPRTEVGGCAPHKGHFYKKVTYLRWKRRNCACLRQSSFHLRLCRCRRGVTVKSCESGCIVHTKRWWQPVKGRCVSRVKVVSRIFVTCSSQKRVSYGSCGIVRGGKIYQKVTLRWQRKYKCRCHSVKKTHLRLCGCPKSHRRTRCHGNSNLITTTYKYRLHSGRCLLKKREHRRRIHCDRARTQIGKCVNGRQAVKVHIFTPFKCHCKRKVYTRTVKCRGNCKDMLPKRVCSKWAIGHIRLCDKHKHLAAKLCARTCGTCFSCLTTTMVYAGRMCLSHQPGFNHRHVIGKAATLSKCMSRCHGDKRCRAFDFDYKRRTCRLLATSRRSLKGSRGGRCLLFVKVCPKKCPYRRVVKKFKCVCKRLRRRLCFRLVKVVTFRRGRDGKCRQRVQRVHTPCRECEDRTHPKWCRRHRSKCSRPQVSHLCPLTCGACKRKPLVLTQKGRCSKSGRRNVVKATRFFDKRLKMWIVRYSHSHQPCASCPVGAYSLIGECIRGHRKVTRVRAAKVKGKCRIATHTKIISCRGCPFSLKRIVGSCRRRGSLWHRRVVTFFTVRLSKKCHVRRSVRVFSCSPKCPKDKVQRSRCHCGKRIRCLVYFVTFAGSRVCVPKRHSTTEFCVSPQACRDRLRLIDCLVVKKKGMCKKMHAFCARTCGTCR